MALMAPRLLLLSAALAQVLVLALAPAGASPCGPGEQCVPLARCLAALRARHEEPPRRPKHCGFADSSTRIPDVCCALSGHRQSAAGDQSSACPSPAPLLSPDATPTVTCEQLSKLPPLADDKSPGSLARRMCRKHQEDLCALPSKGPQFGACSTRGELTDTLEFPHMALLGYGERDDLRFACGGSLIAPDFILAPAHCASLQGKPASWVLLGVTNRTMSREPKVNDTQQLLKVAEVVMHPEYVATLQYHDIALLRLEQPARVKAEEVYPACLNTELDADNMAMEAVATRWGSTGHSEEVTQTLIRANLKLRELQYCRDNVDLEQSKYTRGLQDDTQLCAGGGADTQDTCQGETGGLLQVRASPRKIYDPCMYRIIGVKSFRTPCDSGKPDIYTKVAAYVPWIESIVWPTRQDGCASNVRVKFNDSEVQVPNSGPGSIARGMCRAYHAEFCTGTDMKIIFVKPDLSLDNKCHHNHQGPWAKRDIEHTTVTFRYGDSVHNLQHGCAGALVSPDTVLTAGRCAALGCIPLTQAVLDMPSDCTELNVVDVDRVVVHPEYRPGRAYADLAVVKLLRSFDLREFLPLCLNTPADVEVRAGLRANASGWSIEGTWEELRHSLPDNTVTVRDPGSCSAALLGAARLEKALPEGYHPSLLCAGGLCDNETYAGDYGTPLTVLKHILDAPSGPHYVEYALGVASSLTYCTARDAHGRRLPDLFADVAQHIGWIERTVWPDQ